MDANQLVTSLEDYFVCHRLAPQITLISKQIIRQRRKRFRHWGSLEQQSYSNIHQSQSSDSSDAGD